LREIIPELKLIGRQKEIWDGINVSPEKALEYRRRWIPRLENQSNNKDFENILLVNHLCPGDILVMSAAVFCLKRQHPNYRISVRTSYNAIFENNPDIESFNPGEKVRRIKMEYPLIHQSNQRLVHFLHGYVDYLAKALNISLTCSTHKPFLYLSEEEKDINFLKNLIPNEPYWLLAASNKKDYTVKKYRHERWQELVDKLPQVKFVQVGAINDDRPYLKNVIDLVGKTSHRQLISLAYHSCGGVGLVSYPHHIYAALSKPFVTISSGFEPVSWEKYRNEIFLSSEGILPCCSSGGCWKSRVVPLNDGDRKDNNLCVYPSDGVGMCMDLISSDEVVNSIKKFLFANSNK
jgi:ADP-heptose:LPS heptosyltransferase